MEGELLRQLRGPWFFVFVFGFVMGDASSLSLRLHRNVRCNIGTSDGHVSFFFSMRVSAFAFLM
jgi:hypothetical protein